MIMRAIHSTRYLSTLFFILVSSCSYAEVPNVLKKVVCINSLEYIQTIEPHSLYNSYFCIALRSIHDETCVAYISGEIYLNENDKHIGEYNSLFVHQGYQHIGLERYLSEQAIDYFKNQGCINSPVKVTVYGTRCYIQTIDRSSCIKICIFDAKDNATIGHITTSISSNGEGYIHLLSVEKPFRHQGFGAILFKRALNSLIKHGCKKVSWSAQPFEETCSSSEKDKLFYRMAMERLVGWYQKLGGKVVAAHPSQTAMELIVTS